MEFPAVGYRGTSGSLISSVGAYGGYWSSVTSTSYSNFAYYLYFHSGDLYVIDNDKQTGQSVRCVR
ncbi:MAG: fibrobacter succinogenes major paralogous domain-containing protein [Rikenellaceae bacterium]|nr:fibrobacter succinogenes major paralogous domain-containing protein [Rikenellaceae bacterium]MDE7355654.1 fibrobacter succinogenes major paralogous domain-containing protein [Rikenellaceae bacterium]